jgi:protein-tyrosine phosphatase
MAAHGGRELMEDELAQLQQRERADPPPAVAATYAYADASLEMTFIKGAGERNAIVRGYTDKILVHQKAVAVMRKAKKEAMAKRAEFKAQDKKQKEAYSRYVTISADADLDEEDMDAQAWIVYYEDKNAKLIKAGRTTELVEVPTPEEMQARIDVKTKLKQDIQDAWNYSMDQKNLMEDRQRESAELYAIYAKEVRLEKMARDEVTDDHRDAKKRGITLMDMFPKVHIWDALLSVNDIHTWGLPFAEIMEILRDEPTPHKLEWGRYDYREDIFGNWLSFAQLRSAGKWAPDYEVDDNLFVKSCASADLSTIDSMLKHGHELRINNLDMAGNTALHAAITNGHDEVVQRLLEHGADPAVPNNCGLTPWFCCAASGELYLVKKYKAFAIDPNTLDKQGHSVVNRAVMSKNLELVYHLVAEGGSLLYINRIWGWTMLHYAAQLGDTEFVEKVLKAGVSPYFPSKQGSLASKIAAEHGHDHIVSFLEQFMSKEPGQFMGKFSNGEIWLGARDAAKRSWADGRGINSVLSLKEDPSFHYTGLSWTEDNDEVTSLQLWVLNAEDTEGNRPKWKGLMKVLLRAHNFIHDNLKAGRNLLIHCDEGISTSVTVMMHYLMTKRQMRYPDARKSIKKIRPSIAMLPEMEQALQEFEVEVDRRRVKEMETKQKGSIMISLGFNPTRGHS